LLGADLEGLVIFLFVAFGAGCLADQASERDEAPGFGRQHVQRRFGGRIGQDVGPQAFIRIGCVPVGTQYEVELRKLGLDLIARQGGRYIIRARDAFEQGRYLRPAQVEVLKRRERGVRQALAGLFHGTTCRCPDIIAQGGITRVVGRLCCRRGAGAGCKREHGAKAKDFHVHEVSVMRKIWRHQASLCR